MHCRASGTVATQFSLLGFRVSFSTFKKNLVRFFPRASQRVAGRSTSHADMTASCDHHRATSHATRGATLSVTLHLEDRHADHPHAPYRYRRPEIGRAS